MVDAQCQKSDWEMLTQSYTVRVDKFYQSTQNTHRTGSFLHAVEQDAI